MDKNGDKKMRTKEFKTWVESHNPELIWDWSNPSAIERQLVNVIKECGGIDFKTIVEVFVTGGDLSIPPEHSSAWVKWSNE